MRIEAPLLRSLVVGLPGLAPQPDPDLWRDGLPTLADLTARGQIWRVSEPDVPVPAALWLGLGPDEGQLAPGPIRVAAMGFDPPERSTHFAVDALSLDEGSLRPIATVPSAVEQSEIQRILSRLNTPRLTFLAGTGNQHGLVWEDLVAFRTVPPSQAVGQRWDAVQPEGDHERILRRWMDDAVNLLFETEFNQRRIDEGLAPLNVMWPWGAGVRLPLPNLPLRWGLIPTVHAEAEAIRAIARLCGLPLTPRAQFRQGLATDFRGLAEWSARASEALVMFTPPGSDPEEQAWFLRHWDEEFLRPWRDAVTEAGGSWRLTMIATGAEAGLALSVGSGSATSQSVPFDARASEERLRATSLSDLVRRGLLDT